jgi:hypothetical protein
VVYLPVEKAVWSADISAVNPNPAQASRHTFIYRRATNP